MHILTEYIFSIYYIYYIKVEIIQVQFSHHHKVSQNEQPELNFSNIVYSKFEVHTIEFNLFAYIHIQYT